MATAVPPATVPPPPSPPLSRHLHPFPAEHHRSHRHSLFLPQPCRPPPEMPESHLIATAFLVQDISTGMPIPCSSAQLLRCPCSLCRNHRLITALLLYRWLTSSSSHAIMPLPDMLLPPSPPELLVFLLAGLLATPPTSLATGHARSTVLLPTIAIAPLLPPVEATAGHRMPLPSFSCCHLLWPSSHLLSPSTTAASPSPTGPSPPAIAGTHLATVRCHHHLPSPDQNRPPSLPLHLPRPPPCSHLPPMATAPSYSHGCLRHRILSLAHDTIPLRPIPAIRA